MAVTAFDTKVAVVVRDDLAGWQKLNVTAFLISGVIAAAGETGGGVVAVISGLTRADGTQAGRHDLPVDNPAAYCAALG